MSCSHRSLSKLALVLKAVLLCTHGFHFIILFYFIFFICTDFKWWDRTVCGSDALVMCWPLLPFIFNFSAFQPFRGLMFGCGVWVCTWWDFKEASAGGSLCMPTGAVCPLTVEAAAAPSGDTASGVPYGAGRSASLRSLPARPFRLRDARSLVPFPPRSRGTATHGCESPSGTPAAGTWGAGLFSTFAALS